MRMETEYLVTAETEEAIQAIASVWGYEFAKIDGCSFEVEGEDSQIFDIMERVMKTVHWMENGGKKENFRVVGLGDTDYDATVFSIEYDGKADYDEIPKLLKRNKNRTFKQAIKDELPLGGFLDVSYEEWRDSVLNA